MLAYCVYMLKVASIDGHYQVACHYTIFIVNLFFCYVKVKGSPYSITERRVPELIPLLGSQPAGDVSHKPGGGRLPLLEFSPGLQLLPQPLRGLLPILLLGEQRRNGCEQFA